MQGLFPILWKVDESQLPPGFAADGGAPPPVSEPYAVLTTFLLHPEITDESTPSALGLLWTGSAVGEDVLLAQSWLWQNGVRPEVEAAPASGESKTNRNNALFGASAAAAGVASLLLAPVALPVVAAGFGYAAFKRGKSSNRRATQAAPIELRRMQYAGRWVRKDNLVHVPPGAAFEYSVKSTSGMSKTTTKELSSTLGPDGLSSLLQAKTGQQIALSRLEEKTHILRLSNDRVGYDRYFAIWFREHVIRVEVLGRQLGSESLVRWKEIQKVVWTDSSEPVPRGIDVPAV